MRPLQYLLFCLILSIFLLTDMKPCVFSLQLAVGMILLCLRSKKSWTVAVIYFYSHYTLW